MKNNKNCVARCESFPSKRIASSHLVDTIRLTKRRKLDHFLAKAKPQTNLGLVSMNINEYACEKRSYLTCNEGCGIEFITTLKKF